MVGYGPVLCNIGVVAVVQGLVNCEIYPCVWDVMVGQGPVLVIYGMYRYVRDQCLWRRGCTGMTGTSSINLGDMR